MNDKDIFFEGIDEQIQALFDTRISRLVPPSATSTKVELVTAMRCHEVTFLITKRYIVNKHSDKSKMGMTPQYILYTCKKNIFITMNNLVCSEEFKALNSELKCILSRYGVKKERLEYVAMKFREFFFNIIPMIQKEISGV